MHTLFFAASISMMTLSAVGADSGWSTSGRNITLADARRVYPALETLQSITSEYSSLAPDTLVRIVDGDLTIDGPLLCDWQKGDARAGLVVTGNLRTSGPIVNTNLNGGPFLLVLGETRAPAIVAGGAELMFVGDATIEEIVVGEYNDGILRFGGRLTVPVAVTNDHHFEVASGVQGRWLDPFNEGHRWRAVLHPDIEVPVDDDGMEEFDVMRSLVPRLLARQPVLRDDLPPLADYPELFE